jgi:hypothetical protein
LAIYAGCDSPPPRVNQVSYTTSDAQKAMDMFDTDKNGKISGTELDKAPGLKAALTVLGADKDKSITKEQIAARIQKWIDSKIGRQTVSCTVFRNGAPLENATVKFVPEKFLTETIKLRGQTLIGVGKTNASGMAMISWPTTKGPDGDPAGIGPGIYRIEVTKDGETIPAKYNTETTLGQEISQDNIELQRGLKYYLTY